VQIEKPPISDTELSAYLVRAFTAINNAVDATKTFVVTGPVKNPRKGKLYLVGTPTTQFASIGIYYYDGSSFILIADGTSLAKIEHNTLTGLNVGDYQHLTVAQLNKLLNLVDTPTLVDVRPTIAGYIALGIL
jgi:hypothetical protein